MSIVFTHAKDGRKIVTDLELFNKAMSRYRAYCNKLNASGDLPSASMTEFEEIDACHARVTLHNSNTCRESIDNPKACLFTTKIKVTNDAESSYTILEGELY